MTDSLCSWTKGIIPVLREKIKNEDTILVTLPSFNDVFLKQQAEGFKLAIEDYNGSLRELLRLRRESSVGVFVFTIQMLSPILLILGLAVRFSKTAAEIRLDKNLD